MTKIAVTQITDDAGCEALETGLNSLTDQIRERAYGIYQERGSGDGAALDHWLEAERDLTVRVESDLVETDTAFELSAAVDGLDASNLAVSASSDALAVKGRSSAGERVLFTRFRLPGTIAVDRVTAMLDNGILRVSAQKADTAGKRTLSRSRGASAKVAAA